MAEPWAVAVKLGNAYWNLYLNRGASSHLYTVLEAEKGWNDDSVAELVGILNDPKIW